MFRETYGPYRVEAVLGQGGTGAVLRCRHRDSGELVALKVSKAEKPRERESLRREIGLLSRMSRAGIQGIVRILDNGRDMETPWYAMELLEGRSLSSWIHETWSASSASPSAPVSELRTLDIDVPGTIGETLHRIDIDDRSARADDLQRDRQPLAAGGQLESASILLLRIAEVLSHLHAEGVVHGDLTPNNIIVRESAEPVLIDFGIGLAQLAPNSSRELLGSAPGTYGTPAYLAPEVLRGEVRDARCDLYALGCIMYEVFTGRRPFSASEASDIISQQLYADPVPPSRCATGLPPGLDALVLGLLEKDPLLRTPRSEDVCELLCRHMQLSPTLHKRATRTTLYRSRLRGRDIPLSELMASLERSLSGHGEFILLSGPSGIGKTRLMKELVPATRAANGLVLWGRGARAGAAEATSGFVPGAALELFSSVVEHVLDTRATSQHGDAARVDAALHDVIGVMPGFAAQASRDGPALVAQPSSQLAMAGLWTLLEHIANGSGLVLLLDDVQSADELSVSFVKRYARRLSRLPVLVVATYGTEGSGLEHGDPLASLATHHIELGALNDKQAERVAKDILATNALPAGLFGYLFKYSKGNPLYVSEYVRALVSGSVLRPNAAGSWSFDQERADEMAVPASIEELLQLGVQELAPRARRALQLASILSSDFDVGSFESLVGLELDPTDLLDELVALDMIQITSPSRFRFVHEAVREALERTLFPSERERYHGHVACRLERDGELGNLDVAGAVGYHWANAGDPQRALPHLERAASRARSGHTLERAAELLRIGIKQCQLIGPEKDAGVSLARVCEALADLLIQQAKHLEARERFEQLLKSIPSHQRLTRARLCRKLATTHWTVHDYDSAARALDQAEAELGAVSEPEHYVELIEICLGRFEQLYFSGDNGPIIAALSLKLGELLERHGTNDQRCFYYFVAASHVMLKQRYRFDQHALDLALRGLTAAASVAPQRLSLARFIVGFALALGTREQCQSSLQHFEGATQEAERTEEVTLLSRIRTYHTIALLRVGDEIGTATLAELALEAAGEAHLQPYLGAARICQGWVAWRAGEAQRAKALLEAGRDHWRASAHGFPFSNLALFPLIDLARQKDDFEVCRALLEESRAGLPALPSPLVEAIGAAIRAVDDDSSIEASRALELVIQLARRLAFA